MLVLRWTLEGAFPPLFKSVPLSGSDARGLRSYVERHHYAAEDAGLTFGRSSRSTGALAEAGAVTSVGSRGGAPSTTPSQSRSSGCKTELVRGRGPWRGIDDVEHATQEWVDWLNTQSTMVSVGSSPN